MKGKNLFLKNCSSRHPTKKLKPLIDFVLRRARKDLVAGLRLEDHKAGRVDFAGLTKSMMDGSKRAIGSFVTIWIPSQEAEYPFVNRYVRSVPVRLESWAEEFVHVLAHELRHVEQHTDGRLLGAREKYKAEVDAERFGLGVLEKFRARRRG